MLSDESLRRDRGGVLAAVTKNGLALQFADHSFKSDRYVVLAAVRSKGWTALECAECLQVDDEFLAECDIIASSPNI